MGLTELSMTDATAIVAALVALISLTAAIVEYRRRGVLQRAQQFVIMRRLLKENLAFKRICELLETDDSRLKEVPFADKRDFLGLFEEVALMMQSKLIRREVAHYMFGYYAILCWESDNFWFNPAGGPYLTRDSPYWRVFREFVTQMRQVEKSGQQDTSNLRF